MAILTSYEIREQVIAGGIMVSPYDEARVQQNSLDVTLGTGVCTYDDAVGFDEEYPFKIKTSINMSEALIAINRRPLSVKHDNPVERYDMDDSGWVVKPGILYLMHVAEVLCAPNLVMTLDGRSSYARLGIVVHLTAGHAETGFHGQYTLEVTAVHPVTVYPGIAIAQVIFNTVEGEVEDYRKRGNYVGQAAMGAQPSRSWRQFK